MKEFFLVLGSTVAIAVVIVFVARWIEPFLRVVENGLTFMSTAIIVFVMFYICAEVVMRYGFNAPIQGHLEGSELLVTIIVFFAVSYTQARNGHVGMDLVIENLPAGVRRWFEVMNLVLAVFICSILAYFSGKYALQLYEYDDVTMTPPYWRTWPSAAAITLGYGMLSVRTWLQALYLISPTRFPGGPEEELEELHATE